MHRSHVPTLLFHAPLGINKPAGAQTRSRGETANFGGCSNQHGNVEGLAINLVVQPLSPLGTHPQVHHGGTSEMGQTSNIEWL